MPVAALEQHDHASRADTADTDDLVGHVDDGVVAEQMLAVVRQRGQIRAEEVLDLLGTRGRELLVEPEDQRRDATRSDVVR